MTKKKLFLVLYLLQKKIKKIYIFYLIFCVGRISITFVKYTDFPFMYFGSIKGWLVEKLNYLSRVSNSSDIRTQFFIFLTNFISKPSERQRDRETERQRDREIGTERQRDRKTDRETKRHVRQERQERQAHRQQWSIFMNELMNSPHL